MECVEDVKHIAYSRLSGPRNGSATFSTKHTSSAIVLPTCARYCGVSEPSVVLP